MLDRRDDLDFWEKILNRTQYATQSGALRTIGSDAHLIQDGSIRFVVRVPRYPSDDHEKGDQLQSGINPFLPYEKDLFVTELSESYICLLNKFNLLDHHVLLVTRAFKKQETALKIEDFEALWLCVGTLGGLGFYNSDVLAGASQRHRHLQWVSTPFGLNGQEWKLSSIFSDVQFVGRVGRSRHFSFDHALVYFDWRHDDSSQASVALLESYNELRNALALETESEAYNLLVTRECMIIIPRELESWNGISVNALGFAGSILVPDRDSLEQLRSMGPIQLLGRVARSKEQGGL